MGLSLVASTFAYNNGSGQVTTSALDSTGGKLIVVGGFGQSTPTISDSLGVSWTGLTPKSNGVAVAKLFYKNLPSTGSLHTFTLTNFSMFGGIFVWVFAGTDQSGPLDGESGSAAAGVATIQPGAVTPSMDGCVAVTVLSHADSAAPAVPSLSGGFTYAATQFTAGQHYGGGGGHLILSGGSGTPLNPTWTNNGTFNSAAVMAVFKPAAAKGFVVAGGMMGALSLWGNMNV